MLMVNRSAQRMATGSRQRPSTICSPSDCSILGRQLSSARAPDEGAIPVPAAAAPIVATAARATRRNSSVVYLDLSYTYDAMGNIVHCVNDQQDTLYFRGKAVKPDQEFTYDSLYRLVEANGREHLGQRGGGPGWGRNEVSGEAF